jgi:hypothetical protein
MPFSNRRLRPSRRVSALLVALAFFAGAGRGQVLYGSLTGNVTDASGAAVPAVKVEVRNDANGTAKQGLTDEHGTYLFGDLQPGTYRVTISAPAFSTRVLEGATVSLNSVLRLDVSLSVSQVVETLQVSASATALQTDRADINNQIRSTQITDLPLINSQGRNFQVLYKILPGFTPPVEAHSDSGNPQRSMVTQANGMPQSSNNTKLDGATISHPWLPRLVAYLPPVEAVETVNVVSNSFDAEQGMAGGAAMNVTIKSGTNAFHGAGWEFMTNSVLKARNYFYCLYSCTGDPNRAPKNVQNQFGGMFGGPIKKNKLAPPRGIGPPHRAHGRAPRRQLQRHRHHRLRPQHRQPGWHRPHRISQQHHSTQPHRPRGRLHVRPHSRTEPGRRLSEQLPRRRQLCLHARQHR